jgi:methionine--tRNA ligase beta chain
MKISYKDFKKLDIKVGVVKECIDIEKSDNLYKLIVDCGEPKLRQIVTGMKKFYDKKDFIGTKLIILTNLESKKIMGIESQGMVLAADVDHQPILLRLDENKRELVPPGTPIK